MVCYDNLIFRKYVAGLHSIYRKLEFVSIPSTCIYTRKVTDKLSLFGLNNPQLVGVCVIMHEDVVAYRAGMFRHC